MTRAPYPPHNPTQFLSTDRTFTGSMEWFEDSLGDAFLRLGRNHEASAEYQRVHRINPNHAMARYHLAVAYQRKHQLDRAREEYRKFVQTWNADPDIPALKAARAATQLQ